MRSSARLTTWILLVALAALVFPACGGGGGGGDAQAPTFHGAYGFLLVEWIGADEYARSTSGSLFADESVVVDLDIYQSVQAGHERASALAPLTYTETGPGTALITDGGGRRFHAELSADGSLITATTRDMGTEPALLLLVQRAVYADPSGLAGDWMEVTWARETDTSGPRDVIGDQALAVDQTLHPNGELVFGGGPQVRFEEYWFIPAAPSSTTIVSSGRGAVVEWNRVYDGALTHMGSVSADGNLMLLGGDAASTISGGTICVRRRLATSVDALAGDYRSCGLGSSALGHHVRWGTVSFDGLGGGSGSHTHNVEGLVLGPASEPLTYEVDAEGRLSVEWSDERVPLQGIVGPDGAYAVLAGGFRNGEPAEIHVLVR